MRSLLIIIAFIAFIHLSAHAQYYTTGNTPSSTTKIVEQSSVTTVQDSLQLIREKEWNKHLIINSDSRVDSIIRIHCEENKRKNGVNGYRVQIFQGTHEEALQIEARFLSGHEGIKTHVEFPSPYFTLRIGDFRTKSEACKLKQLVQNEYPASYIVDCIINFPDLTVAELKN
jgi:hypothetical protein